MNQDIMELKERFGEIIQIDSAEDFFKAFCEFLRYIADTPALRKHAQKVLREKPASSMIYAVNTLFTELNKRWEDDYNAEKQIWSEILKKFAGRPSECKTPILFTDLLLL